MLAWGLGKGFSGDFGGVIELMGLEARGSTMYLLPWTDRTGTYDDSR